MRAEPTLCALALAAGCGRIGFDASGSDAGGPIDAVDAAFPVGPFGAPRAIPAIASPAQNQEPSMTGDALELYFRRDVGADADIFVSHRATRSDDWDTPVAVFELNSSAEDVTPGVAPDGLTIWFTSNRPGTANYDVFVSTRADRGSPWSPPVPVNEVNTADGELRPAVSPDGLEMLVTKATGAYNVLRSTRTTQAVPWPTPQPFADLDSVANEAAAHRVWPLEILFSSQRTGNQWDLYRARRATTLDAYTVIEPLSELNTGSIEFDPWMSVDGHTILFGSDRVGNYDIYEATR